MLNLILIVLLIIILFILYNWYRIVNLKEGKYKLERIDGSSKIILDCKILKKNEQYFLEFANDQGLITNENKVLNYIKPESVEFLHPEIVFNNYNIQFIRKLKIPDNKSEMKLMMNPISANMFIEISYKINEILDLKKYKLLFVE